MRPIFDRFPGLRERVLWEPVGTFPTPVEPILGLWVKRDDRTHPEFGGSKIRNLEFYLPRFRGPTLAFGPRASTWLKAVSHFAPHTRLLTFPQAMNATSVAVPGARYIPDPVGFALALLLEAPRLLGESVAVAPIGGTDPITCLGHVNAALELAGQIRDRECPKPDAIYVPMGSCGTAAGLALGLGIAGIDTTIFAVRITSRLVANARRLHALAIQCAWLLDVKDLRFPRIEVIGDQLGDGYAHPTPQAVEMKRRFSETGVTLDLTYSAKTAAAWWARKTPNSLLWLTYSRPR